MSAYSTGIRQVEASRKRRKTCVRLDLKLVANKHDAVEPQTGHSDEHRRPGPVVEHEAHALHFRPQAHRVSKTLGKIPRDLRSRAGWWEIGRDGEEKLSAIELSPAGGQHGFKFVVALGRQRKAQRCRADGRLECGRNFHLSRSRVRLSLHCVANALDALDVRGTLAR